MLVIAVALMLQIAPATLPPETRIAYVAAGTWIDLELVSEVTSKTAKIGDVVRLLVKYDVMPPDSATVAIPRSTLATGVVTQARKKGALGRRGELMIELRTLELGGKLHPIRGSLGDVGEGGTGNAVATAAVAGPFALFVTGKSASLPAGTTFRAELVAPIAVTIDLSYREAYGDAVSAVLACAKGNADRWLVLDEDARAVARAAINACSVERQKLVAATRDWARAEGVLYSGGEADRLGDDGLQRGVETYVLDRRAARRR